MGSEEWKFLLNFAKNQEDDEEGSGMDTEIKKIAGKRHKSSFAFKATTNVHLISEDNLSCLTEDVRLNIVKLSKLKRFEELLTNDSSIEVCNHNIFLLIRYVYLYEYISKHKVKCNLK